MTRYDKKFGGRLVDDPLRGGPVFAKKTGDYVGGGNLTNDIGRADDSLLSNITLIDYENQQRVFVGGDSEECTPDQTVHPVQNLVSTQIVQDLDRIVRGRGERLETDFIREQLRLLGHDPDNLPQWPERKRRVFHNDCVRELRRRLQERDRSHEVTRTYDMLLIAKDDDPVLWSPQGLASHKNNEGIHTTAGTVRAALGMSVEELLALPVPLRLKALKKVDHRLRRGGARAAVPLRFTEERTTLHVDLCGWAQGELRLERPQSSSLHLMVEYDKANSMGEFARVLDNAQVVVVENDWGASVPPVEGEWRLPYPLMCWEFRISGVRVLVFTDCENEGSVPQLYCVYGRDGHWVIDDFYYHVSGGAQLGPGHGHRVRTDGLGGRDTEFRRVASMVHDAIRAVCIMLDARVAHAEQVAAPQKIVERRRSEKRTPPRDHIVVRLFGTERRSYAARSKIVGRISDARAPQRGHWRKGTWVHYDDPDSGQVQYPNDGGFLVSKTWRRWHFAGDPNNILHKELRA